MSANSLFLSRVFVSTIGDRIAVCCHPCQTIPHYLLPRHVAVEPDSLCVTKILANVLGVQ